jgi:hypothetical protein
MPPLGSLGPEGVFLVVRWRTMRKKNLGSSIDDFLRQENIFEEAQAQAVKEVMAWQLAEGHE